jgi:hypothetical protein
MVDASPEIVVKALTERAGTNPAETAFISSLRAKLQKDGAPSTSQTVAGRNFDTNVLTYVAEESIGTDRDLDGKKVRIPGSEEDIRMNRLKAAQELMVHYLEKGYDNLTPTEKTEARRSIINLAKAIPAFEVEFRSMSAAEQQIYAEKILKDPRYSQKLKEKLTEKGGDISKIVPDQIGTLSGEVATLEAEVSVTGSITAEIANFTSAITNTQTDLAEYQVEVTNPGPPVTVRPGVSYARISALQVDINTDEANLVAPKETLKDLQDHLEGLQFELTIARGRTPPRGYAGRTAADIGAINTDIRLAEREIAAQQGIIKPAELAVQSKKDLLVQLKQQEVDLKAKLATLKTDRTTKETEKRTKESDLTTKKIELAKKKAERRLKEEQFVRSFEVMMEDAAEDYVKEQVDKAVSDGKTLAETQTAESKVEAKKKLIDTITKTYFPSSKLMLSTVKSDFNLMSRSGAGVLTRTMLGRAGYTAPEIDVFLKDEELAKEMQRSVRDNCTKFYFLRGGFLQRGGKLDTDSILKFAVSDWGQDLITEGIKNKKSLQEQIEAASGASMLTAKGQFGEFIKKMPLGSLALVILSILLGGAGITKLLHP